MWNILGPIIPIANLAESFVDDVIRDKVEPIPGSVVYCDLAMGFAEHSGIYIGYNKIVQLNKYGDIEIVSLKEFIDGTTAMNILVSCKDTEAVGSQEVARRAENMVGKSRDYNVILDNCHQFTAGCLTGDFEDANNFLTFLKMQTEKVLGTNTWRHWDIELI